MRAACSPTPTSSWVVPKKLLGGRFPSAADVVVLQEEAEVSLFVNLCEPWEFGEGRRQRAIDYNVPEECQRMCFSIPDRSVPEDNAECIFSTFYWEAVS